MIVASPTPTHIKTALLSRTKNKETNEVKKQNKKKAKQWQQQHKLESTHQQTGQQQQQNPHKTKTNKNNNNKKKKKNIKKIKSNHPTITCGARTCDSGR